MPVRLSGEPCPVFYTEPQKRCQQIGEHPEKYHWHLGEIFEAQTKQKKRKGWKSYGCYFEALKEKGGTGKFSEMLKCFIKIHIINYST